MSMFACVRVYMYYFLLFVRVANAVAAAAATAKAAILYWGTSRYSIIFCCAYCEIVDIIVIYC